MKFLVDANLSPKVANLLIIGGCEAMHVQDVGHLTSSDEIILEWARDRDFIIVSADADFGALLALGQLGKPSLVLLRSTDQLSPEEQTNILLANLPTVAVELENGSIVTFSRGRMRIRSLPIGR